MVKLYTKLSLEYPLIFVTLQLIIVYYEIKYCKNNYKTFTLKDMGASQVFMLACGLSFLLLIYSIKLILIFLNNL